MPIDQTDIAICLEDDPISATGSTPMATPIVQTSLFAFPNFQSLLNALAAEHRNHVYTRGQNPTVEALEHKLATLERGEACKCFASGMAAISAVMMGLLRSGDHILFVNHTYGPTIQLAEQLRRFGIEHDILLDVDVESVERALKPHTKLVWLENPGTMLFHTLDLQAVATVARDHGAITCIDNSWATPLLQKPITHGVDVVVHSMTKYIGGHSDVIAGAVITTAERLEQIFYRAYLLNGGVLGPFDAWLLLRGLRTLPTRMRQHEADALRVAEYLRGHGSVRRVFHPAFTTPSKTLTGSSGLFSFELNERTFDCVAQFIDALNRFRIGVSWGGFESLVISPNRGTNLAALDTQHIPHSLIRLSIGLEGADFLIDDLEQAFRSLSTQ